MSLPIISSKTIKALRRLFVSKDNHRASLTSIGIGETSIAATNTHILAIVGTPNDTYKTTDERAVALAVATSDIYKYAIDLSAIGEMPSPPKGSPPVFPAITGTVCLPHPNREYKSVAVNPKLLRAICDLAMANGSRRMLMHVSENMVPVRFDFKPESEDAAPVVAALMPMEMEGWGTAILERYDPKETP